MFPTSTRPFGRQSVLLYKTRVLNLSPNGLCFEFPRCSLCAGYQRIHFGSFVLIYKIEADTVRIIALDHHDNAY